MAYKSNGYIKVDGPTRPICGKFELSAAYTKLAKEIADQKDLSDFIGEEIEHNAFVIPVGTADDLYFRDNRFNCYFVRDGGVISMKDMYINEQYLELIRNSVAKKAKVCNESIYKRLGEHTDSKDTYDENYESEDEDEEKIVFDAIEENINFEEDIDDELMDDEDEDEGYDEDYSYE